MRYRDTDFAAIARAMGIAARRVDGRRRAARRRSTEAFARPGPYLIDAIVDPSGYRGRARRDARSGAMTVAGDDRRVGRGADATTTSRPRPRGREAAPARHARRRARSARARRRARPGRTASALGGTGASSVIGLRARACRPRRRRWRTACSATASTSTTPTRTRSATSASSSRRPPSRWPRRRGASGRRAAAGARRRQRDHHARRRGGGGRVHGARVPPTSVSGVFGAAVAAARLQRPADRRRSRRPWDSPAAWRPGSSPTSATARRRSPCMPAGRRTAGSSRPTLAAAGAEGPVPVFEDGSGSSPPTTGGTRPRSRHRSPTSERAGRRRASRSSPTPRATSCTAASTPRRACSREHPLAADEIERIIVAVPDPGIPLVLEPVEAKRDPRTEYDAKFSLQYSIAALIVHGHVGVETYTEAAHPRSPRVLALAARVEHVRRAFPTYPRSFPGWVRIETRSGEVLELELAHQRGGPENPMARGRGAAKFRANAVARPRPPSGRRARAGAALARAIRTTSRAASRRCATPLPAMQRA